MAKSLHIRLDDGSAAALETRRRLRSGVREEVRVLAADEHDREEIRVMREQLAELAPTPRDG